MIQQDTINTFHDSAKVLSTDSVVRLDTQQILNHITKISHNPFSKLDTIFAPDSSQVADALITADKLPRGFVGIALPSLPQTEGWVFVTLLVLFLLFVLSISHSSGLLSETLKTFFQVKERSSIFTKRTINHFRFQFFLIIFSIGVLSLYAYILLHQAFTPFSLEIYSYFLAILLISIGIKSIVFDLIGYVFFDSMSLKIAKENYFNILSFLGITLFPLLIIHIYAPPTFYHLTEIISLIICLIACFLVVIKLFQIFFQKIVASFYIFLYLCTLEFLPLIAIYLVYQLIVLGVV
jgi:hypothetical protein